VLVPDESEREVNISLKYSLAGVAKGFHPEQCKKFHPSGVLISLFGQGQQKKFSVRANDTIPLTPIEPASREPRAWGMGSAPPTPRAQVETEMFFRKERTDADPCTIPRNKLHTHHSLRFSAKYEYDCSSYFATEEGVVLILLLLFVFTFSGMDGLSGGGASLCLDVVTARRFKYVS
jgi:hypothetical protein